MTTVALRLLFPFRHRPTPETLGYFQLPISDFCKENGGEKEGKNP